MNKIRYFRVGAFYRDENSKEIIVQCYDREEAEGWIDRAKEMLYPGENTDGFIVTVFEFKLQINLNNLNHYRITVERPLKREFKDEWEECDYLTAQAFDALIEAENEIDAKEKFINEHFKMYTQDRTPEQYDIYVDEVPVEKVIEDEQKMLRQRLIGKYISEKYGDISVREYNQMMRRDDENEKNTMFYKALSEHLKRLRMSEYLESRLDTSKLSYADFCTIRSGLCSAKSNEEFEKINLAAVSKYGKNTTV
jgi:uncharacterized membrane-anchored protein YjiN (DUF445 family)